MDNKVTTGTIKAKEDFNPAHATERFRQALKGYYSNEKILIHQLVKHNYSQREAIELKYRTLYGGSDMIEDIRAELSGNFRETVLAMMTFSHELLVTAIRDAILKTPIDEKSLVEVLCCRTPEELMSMDNWYKRKYNISLEEDVLTKVRGDFKKLVQALISIGRDGSQLIDPIRARKDAQDLYDAGLGQSSSSDETAFIRIVNAPSYPQMNEIFKEYENISQEPIEKSINNEFSGYLRQGLLAVVQRVKDPLGFYAERLNESMQGKSTDDKTLIRLIVSRSEIDLEDIKKRYKEMFASTLYSDVRADTSGAYGEILLAIILGKGSIS